MHQSDTEQLIRYVMDSIAKEEKLSQGASGKRRMLSGKERVRLLLEFLDIRANPHKNRTFQHIMTLIEENKKKKLDIKKATLNSLKFE